MESVLEIPLSNIDEDPNQPRTAFDQKALNELAETIRERGVKTPISVRNHPTIEGRYRLNHGARRFRASLLAGKETIPACIDNEYTEEDQLVENLQRENLTSQEIAAFLGKLVAKGRRRGEVARLIGKSSAYVTQHLALLDLPEPVARTATNGQCNDVTVLNELVTLLKRYPQHTEAWLEDTNQEITRTSLKLFRDFLASPEAALNADPSFVPPQPKKKRVKNFKKNPLKKPILYVEWNGQTGVFLLKQRPTKDGLAWIAFEDEEREVPLTEIQITALVERESHERSST